jgi:hypothetical protein
MEEKKNKEEAEFKALYEQFVNWKQSQQGQSDGYAYEESFAVFCQQLNKQLLELATSGDKQTAKKKSTPDLEK